MTTLDPSAATDSAAAELHDLRLKLKALEDQLRAQSANDKPSHSSQTGLKVLVAALGLTTILMAAPTYYSLKRLYAWWQY